MRDHGWRYFLMVALPVGAAFAAAPGLGAAIATCVLATVAALAMLRTTPALPPGRRRAGWIMAAALSANAAAEVVLTVASYTGAGDPPYPGPADALYLVFYPLMAVGLVVLTAGPRRARGAGLDAAITTIGAGVVVWRTFMLPVSSGLDLPLAERLVSLAYPTGDVLLFAVIARTLLGPARRSTPLGLLLGGVGVLFGADLVYLWAELHGTYASGASSDALYNVAYALFAGAVLHPGFARGPGGEERPAGGHRARLAVLGAATLLGPLVSLVDVGTRSATAAVPILASAVTFVLVIVRIAGLLSTVERSGERRFGSLVEHATDVVMVTDPSGTLRYLSPSARRTLRDADLPGGSGALAELVHPDDHGVLAAALARSGDAGDATAERMEARLAFADGTWRTFELTLTDLTTDPDVGGLVWNGHDIDALRRLASFDPLTGLLNRAELVGRMDALLATDAWFALLVYDLDGFKEINDSLGHGTGDRVLGEVAGRLGGAARRRDLVARLGGDEFAVLLLEPGSMAAAFAERTLRTLAEPIGFGDLAVSIEASIGIVERRSDHRDAHAVLREADLAMYSAKAAGKGRAAPYEPELGERAGRHLALRSALHVALAEHQLELWYQPVVGLADGSVHGFEALLRWHHPERGWISPADFIPAAETSNQINVIGRWVLERATEQLVAWRAAPGGAGLTVAVNLSPRQLADANLLADVRRVLDRTGLAPRALCLEITEGAVVRNSVIAARVLAELRDLGVRLAIDDYGSGNASISYLRQFAVDTLKIDRSLVDPLDGTPGPNAAIVRSIVELASALSLGTVGEGVETEVQRAALAALGCGAAQGYLLSRPMNADAATAWLLARTAPGTPVRG